MRRQPVPAAALLAIAAALAFPAGAAAVTVGLGEQSPPAFADPRLRALGLGIARLTVPWDAATTEPGAVAAWLDAATAAGLRPHIAFEHARGDRCPGSPCVLPSRGEYRVAVAAFRARFPQVTTFTTWNEANHQSQPTASRPEAVAGYYDELRAVCPSCTIVAGDVLDSGSYVRWLQRFRAATTSAPRLWGVHDYGDVTYGTTTGVDAVLAAVPGTLWIEETGGIVTLRNAAGVATLPTDEARAAAAIDRAFAIARARPRIARMYVYQWQARPLDRFDAGLVRPDGSARPSLGRLAAGLRALRSAGAATALRWRASWAGAVLVLRATCAARRCGGRVTVTVRGRRLARRTYATTAARRTATVRVRVALVLRTRLRAATTRRVVLTVAARVPSRATERVTLRFGRPAA